MAQNTAQAPTSSHTGAETVSDFAASVVEGIDAVAKPVPAHWEPLPGALRRPHAERAKSDNHLVRDFILAFLLVMGGCLAFFFGQPLVSGVLRSPDFINLFAGYTDEQDSTPLPLPAATPEPFRAVVMHRVNLRALPSTDAPVITMLKRGVAVTILERDGDWDHVQIVISGRTSRQGWAYARYITETAKNSATQPRPQR
jgi:hypothetical protein